MYKNDRKLHFRCNALRQADTVCFLMIFNVRSAQQEPPTFSVRIDRPSTSWLLTLNVNTEPHRQFCPLIKVVSNVTIMLKKREKGAILQSNSTMNGKSDKKINKYRATDG